MAQGKKGTGGERWRHFKHRYGLTKEQYDEALAKQGGRCAICRKEGEVLEVDHDHKTNLVRGLLCHNCNVGLGHFKDSRHRLIDASAYLIRTKSVA